MSNPIVSFAATVGLALLFGFWGYCLVDFARTPEFEMRTYPRNVWLFLLIFTSVFGGAMWLAAGRPRR